MRIGCTPNESHPLSRLQSQSLRLGAGSAAPFDTVGFNDRLPGPAGWRSTLWRFIVRSMGRTQKPACVIAWLLCAVLASLAAHPPHCDLCDGPYDVVSSSAKTIVGYPMAAAQDPCHGNCWCCWFHALSVPGLVPDAVSTVITDVWPESSSPVLAPRSPLFRPPRTAVSA